MGYVEFPPFPTPRPPHSMYVILHRKIKTTDCSDSEEMDKAMIVAGKGSGGSPMSSSSSHQKQRSCSICSFKTFVSSSSSSSSNPSSRTISEGEKTMATGGVDTLLDASFVNIHSPRDSKNYLSSEKDIDSILKDALFNNDHYYTSSGGTSFQDASMKMDAYANAALEMIKTIDKHNSERGEKYFCNVCIERIGHAIDVYSEYILDESIAYDEAASSEEERSSSIRKMLSRVVNMNADTDNNMTVFDGEEDSAIQWAIDSFQLELQALANSCHKQEEELRILQNLMKDQVIRSKTISAEEDRAMEALNALEIDAHTFVEESNYITKQCSGVMAEIDALSMVKLTSIPFKITVDWEEGRRTINQQAGRYPTINNLRLAYRVNKKAGVGRKEICAAWNQAAQLITFTCGLSPSFNYPNVRMIPLSYPCAKILATFPDGQSVHNLGWEDTRDGNDSPPHVPCLSITLFLALLSELSDHIISLSEDHEAPHVVTSPPFPMTLCSIDSVDLTCLGDTDNASWSSVVFCIAVNLRWLSQIVLPDVLGIERIYS